MGLYVIAAISGWVGPLLTPKIGHRGISIWGFGIVLVSLLVAAAAIYTGQKWLLPFVAATFGKAAYEFAVPGSDPDEMSNVRTLDLPGLADRSNPTG